MTTVSGASSTSSAQYTSGVDSSARPGGGMNAAALKKWLEEQVGEMWDKVQDATNGVDARNKSQSELTSLQQRATAGENISAEEVRDVASRMPEGKDRDNVLALVANCATPEKTAELQKAYDDAAVKADAATKKNTEWIAGHHPWEWDQNPYKLTAENASSAANTAKLDLDGYVATTTVTGTNVADGFKNAAGALSKQNDLAMTQLQYTASTAQQAMSLVGNILKIQGDSAKETIGRIS